jgi:putative membrane protein
MHRIDDQTKKAIEVAIETVETKSSAEFVAVITQQSDTYLYIPLLWASFGALVFPAVALFFLNSESFESIYTMQMMVFVVLALLFQQPFLKYRLIPNGVKHQRASRKAKESFMMLGLHKTKTREAVMLFVSLEEHYVEIMADAGIVEKIDNGAWEVIVQTFIDDVRNEAFGEGYLKAIRSCQTLLVDQFPAQETGKNILPNHLIEI